MDEKKAFTSDGCSMFPDYRWKDCCVKHDKIYWNGGSSSDRKDADMKLYRCVKEKGYPFIAKIMYIGVRIGGHPLLPFSWRWGYGYQYPYKYGDNGV